MNKKTLMIGIASFALGGLLFAGFTGAKAYQGNQQDGTGRNQFGLTQEQKTAVDQAIQNNDYNAWKTAMGDNQITQKINESNFSQYVQAQNLIKEGQNKMDEAKAIFDELGIKRGFGNGEGRGLKGCDCGNKTATDTATSAQ